MVIVIRDNATDVQVNELMDWLQGFNVKTNLVEGVHSRIIGLIGDTTPIDIDAVKARGIVEAVKRVQEPYKNANRRFHPDDTIIEAGGVTIGGPSWRVLALWRPKSSSWRPR